MVVIGVSLGKATQGRGKQLRISCLKNFCRLWAIGVVPSCLVPGPGMVKTEEYCCLGCSGQREEVWLWISKAYSQLSPCYL